MASAPSKVDRQTTTPFYLKLFYKTGGFNRLDEFHSQDDLPPHLQIYTWQTATLRELSHLLTSAIPDLLPDPAIGTRLAFRLIFPDTRNTGPGSGPGRYVTKELGSVVIGDGGPGIYPDDEEAAIVAGGQMAGPLGGEPDKTLQDARFVIGDYVSCAILPAMANGEVAPPPGGSNRSGYGAGRGDFGRLGPSGPRENGYSYRGGRGGGSRGGGFGPPIGAGVPSGEWRRGERVPEGPSGRGRGYSGGHWGGGGGGGGGREGGGGRGRY